MPELSGTDTVFAYQLGAGMGYEVTDAITVQVGYRLLKAKQLEFTGMNDLAVQWPRRRPICKFISSR